MFCWSAGYWQIYPESPPIHHLFRDVSVAGGQTCAIREDGRPTCWQMDFYDRAQVLDERHFISISAGDDHYCGLREDGAAVCWGSNHYEASPPAEERFERRQYRGMAYVPPTKRNPRLLG